MGLPRMFYKADKTGFIKCAGFWKSFWYFGNILCQLLLVIQIGESIDHDPLSLRGTGPVHGFGPIPYSPGAKGQIFNQPHDPHPVFRGNGIHPFQVLFDVGAYFRVAQIFFGGLGDHEATGNILCQTGDFIGETGNVLLTDVGQKQIDQIGSGRGLKTFVGTGESRGIDVFVQMGHFNQLVLDVGSFGHSVIISSKSSGTDQYIADAGFAGIAGSVMTAEPFYQHADEVGFSIQENPILRYENMVEDDKGFMTSELAVANIDVPLFHFSGIAGLTAVNQGDPRCV